MLLSNDNNFGHDKSNKRNRSNKNQYQQPRRGFPGIFITCESGREKKCQKEALELIHHYYYLSKSCQIRNDRGETLKASADSNILKSSDSLGLDEELSMLRKGATAEEVLSYDRTSKRQRSDSKSFRSQTTLSSMKSPFSFFDTGIKGMVCVVCTLPGSELIPYDDVITALRPRIKEEQTPSCERGSECSESIVTELPKQNTTGDFLQWDPVETVKIIMKDLRTPSNANLEEGAEGSRKLEHEVSPYSPPGSRFISRMIPIQTTCHASLVEIKAVTKLLLERYFSSACLDSNVSRKTFKVDFKRRNCSHLSRDQVLAAVVPLILEGELEIRTRENIASKGEFAVNLTDPDFSIRIEVCKTLAGISILPRQLLHKNFNLANLCNPF